MHSVSASKVLQNYNDLGLKKICSQLNNKPRVVVTDFRLHHTCSINTGQ